MLPVPLWRHGWSRERGDADCVPFVDLPHLLLLLSHRPSRQHLPRHTTFSSSATMLISDNNGVLLWPYTHRTAEARKCPEKIALRLANSTVFWMAARQGDFLLWSSLMKLGWHGAGVLGGVPLIVVLVGRICSPGTWVWQGIVPIPLSFGFAMVIYAVLFFQIMVV